jgi:TolA-binding protein
MKTKTILTFFSIVFCAVFQAQAAKETKILNSKTQYKKDLELLLQKKNNSRIIKSKGELENFKIVETDFQKLNSKDFRQTANNFLKTFPASPLSDDVLYLVGLSFFMERRYGESLKNFNHIVKFYPNSNRTASAQFAKAILLKKLNLPDMAEKKLFEVMKEFKGSPEAFRAQSELKILRQ